MSLPKFGTVVLCLLITASVAFADQASPHSANSQSVAPSENLAPFENHEFIGRLIESSIQPADPDHAATILLEVMLVKQGNLKAGTMIRCPLKTDIEIGSKRASQQQPGTYLRVRSTDPVSENDQGWTLLGCQLQVPQDGDVVSACLLRWNALKKVCEDSYQYTVRSSNAAGSGHLTQMEIRNGRVIARRYKETLNGPFWHWEEGRKTLGSHKQGAAIQTLDELYEMAQAVASKPLADHERRYLRSDGQGLLTTCFVIDIRIADDAPQTGISIEQIVLQDSKTDVSLPIIELNLELSAEADRDGLAPYVIRSIRELHQVFTEEEDIAAIRRKINFEEQILLVFAWEGSGRDRLTYTVAESFPEQITFRIKHGRTRDLRMHTRAMILRKNVTWSIKE